MLIAYHITKFRYTTKNCDIFRLIMMFFLFVLAQEKEGLLKRDQQDYLSFQHWQCLESWRSRSPQVSGGEEFSFKNSSKLDQTKDCQYLSSKLCHKTDQVSQINFATSVSQSRAESSQCCHYFMNSLDKQYEAFILSQHNTSNMYSISLILR